MSWALAADWRLGGTLLRSGSALGDEAAAQSWAALLEAMAQGGDDHEEARR
jgi:hypothetical protein